MARSLRGHRCQATHLLPLPLAHLDRPCRLLYGPIRQPHRAIATVSSRARQILRSLRDQYVLLRLAGHRLPTLGLLVQLLRHILAVVASGVTRLLAREAWLLLEDLRLVLWLQFRLY